MVPPFQMSQFGSMAGGGQKGLKKMSRSKVCGHESNRRPLSVEQVEW
jgi:hypothetical protein